MNTLTFKHWNWLDNGMLPLLLAVVRSCWWRPWLMLIQRLLAPAEPGVVLPVWLLMSVPLLSLLLARLVAPPTEELSSMVRPEPMPKASLSSRIGIALLGLIVILLVLWLQLYRSQFGLLNGAWLAALGDALIHWHSDAIPGAVLIGIFTAFLWLRGLLDASMRMAHDDVWTVFQTGIVALVLYLVFSAIGGLTLTGWDGALALVLLGSGMAALAASSLKVTAGLDRALGAGQRTTASTPALSSSWLLSTTTVIPLLLIAGVLLGALLAPEMVAALLNWLGDIVAAVGRVVGQIALAIAYVLFLVVYYIGRLLAPLFRKLFPEQEGDPEPMLPVRPPEDNMEQLQQQVTTIPDTYRYIGLAIAIIIMLIVFVIVIRRLRAAAQEEIDESRESILSADLLEAQLSNLWKNLMGRFRQAADALNPFLPLDHEVDARRQIRAAYQHLLQTAEGLGVARQPHATPVEYNQPLSHSLANRLIHANAGRSNDKREGSGERPSTNNIDENLTVITERYYLARYSHVPPSAEDVQAVQQAWAQIQQQLNAENDAEDGKET